jgi:hypothetical protein
MADHGICGSVGDFIVQRWRNFTLRRAMLLVASLSRAVLAVSEPPTHTNPDDLALACDSYAAVDAAIPHGVRLALKRQWAGWATETDVQEQLYNGHPSTSIAGGTSQCTHMAPFFLIGVLSIAAVPGVIGGTN